MRSAVATAAKDGSSSIVALLTTAPSLPDGPLSIGCRNAVAAEPPARSRVTGAEPEATTGADVATKAMVRTAPNIGTARLIFM
jgi:hypothetical protein